LGPRIGDSMYSTKRRSIKGKNTKWKRRTQKSKKKGVARSSFLFGRENPREESKRGPRGGKGFRGPGARLVSGKSLQNNKKSLKRSKSGSERPTSRKERGGRFHHWGKPPREGTGERGHSVRRLGGGGGGGGKVGGGLCTIGSIGTKTFICPGGGEGPSHLPVKGRAQKPRFERELLKGTPDRKSNMGTICGCVRERNPLDI